MSTGYQVSFQTITIGACDFEIRSLKDRQQYADPGGVCEQAGVPAASWPLFGVLWPAGIMLADEMDRYPLSGLRVLEVGCGLGLASLVAHRHGADITASDYNPAAETFLDNNIALNHLDPIKFACIDWNVDDAALGKFDLIIGSDVLYEAQHPLWLATFVARHAAVNCTIMIVDPGRGQRGAFRKRMLGNGFALVPHIVNTVLATSLAFTGQVMVFDNKSL